MNEKKLATHELVRHFKQTDKLHRCLIEQRMKELNLHRSQHIMLMCIAGFDGDAPLTQKMLSQKLDISAATVAVSVKKLEEQGYITRESMTGDGRCNTICITEKGKNILMEAKGIFDEVDSAMINGVSEEELDVFVGCLEKFRSNLKACGAKLPRLI